MTETVSSAIFIDGVAVSPAPPDLVLEYEGEVLTNGNDYLARLKPSGENDWVVEAIRRDGRTSRRFRADGWKAAAEVPRIPDLIRSIESLEPLGSTQRDGTTLLRFAGKSAAAIELAAVWYVDSPRAETDTGTIEILATPLGAPVAAIITIASDDMSLGFAGAPPDPPRQYRVELTWSAAPIGTNVPDPLEKLTPMAVAEHNLTIGLPATWTRETVDGTWVWFQSPAPREYVGVSRFKIPASALGDPPATQLAGWSSSMIKGTQKDLATEVTVVEPVLVAGVPGRLATYDVPAKGGNLAYTQIEAYFVSGKWVYAVRWQSVTPLDLIARYRFEQILETIALSVH